MPFARNDRVRYGPGCYFDFDRLGLVHGRTSIYTDRKSTRLNSSHSQNSYAVFCLKKKSSNKILGVWFNWSRYAQILAPNNKVIPLDLGIVTGPLNPADFGVPVVYASYVTPGYPGGVFSYPISTRPTQTYDASTRLNWTKGKHSFKFGGSYQYASTFSLRNRSRTPFSTYQADFQTVIDELLTGRLDEASRSFGR